MSVAKTWISLAAAEEMGMLEACSQMYSRRIMQME